MAKLVLGLHYLVGKISAVQTALFQGPLAKLISSNPAMSGVLAVSFMESI